MHKRELHISYLRRRKGVKFSGNQSEISFLEKKREEKIFESGVLRALVMGN